MPKSSFVTLQYYRGRVFLFAGKMHDAEQALSSAFQSCHRQSVGNKRYLTDFYFFFF